MQVTLRALWSGMTFSRGWRTFLCFLSNVEIWRECLFIPLSENGLFGEKKVKRPSFFVILGKQTLWEIRVYKCVHLVLLIWITSFTRLHMDAVTWLWSVYVVDLYICTSHLRSLCCSWKEIIPPWVHNGPGKPSNHLQNEISCSSEGPKLTSSRTGITRGVCILADYSCQLSLEKGNHPSFLQRYWNHVK